MWDSQITNKKVIIWNCGLRTHVRKDMSHKSTCLGAAQLGQTSSKRSPRGKELDMFLTLLVELVRCTELMVPCWTGGWNHWSWQGHFHPAEGESVSRKKTCGHQAPAGLLSQANVSVQTLVAPGARVFTTAVGAEPGLQIAFCVTLPSECSVPCPRASSCAPQPTPG